MSKEIYMSVNHLGDPRAQWEQEEERRWVFYWNGEPQGSVQANGEAGACLYHAHTLEHRQKFSALQEATQWVEERCGIFSSWPDPQPHDLDTPAFQAIWDVIKKWHVNAPGRHAFGMRSGATGNEVLQILSALRRLGAHTPSIRNLLWPYTPAPQQPRPIVWGQGVPAPRAEHVQRILDDPDCPAPEQTITLEHDSTCPPLDPPPKRRLSAVDVHVGAGGAGARGEDAGAATLAVGGNGASGQGCAGGGVLLSQGAASAPAREPERWPERKYPGTHVHTIDCTCASCYKR